MPRPPERCPRCLFPPGFCLCPEVPCLAAPFRLVLVRHASERERLSNTARWAALALGAEIVEYGLPGPPLDDAPLRAPGARVLFPSPHPRDADPAPAPAVLIVPDGTWSQSRRMMQRVPALQTIPRLSLASPPAGLRLRRPPLAHGMSTLEAIAIALGALGAPDEARRLLALHDAGVERVLRLKGTWAAELAGIEQRRRTG